MDRDTPRKTALYRRIAKDYNPKQATMMICQYMEGMEARIRELEAALPPPPAPGDPPAATQAPADAPEKKPRKGGSSPAQAESKD